MQYVIGARTAGLCSTCDNNVDAACFYRALRGFDAQYCEMYDDGASATAPMFSVHVKPSASLAAAGRPEPVDSTEFKGLCVNCENRWTCPLARSEGGIWHCEEYE